MWWTLCVCVWEREREREKHCCYLLDFFWNLFFFNFFRVQNRNETIPFLFLLLENKWQKCFFVLLCFAMCVCVCVDGYFIDVNKTKTKQNEKRKENIFHFQKRTFKIHQTLMFSFFHTSAHSVCVFIFLVVCGYNMFFFLETSIEISIFSILFFFSFFSQRYNSVISIII